MDETKKQALAKKMRLRKWRRLICYFFVIITLIGGTIYFSINFYHGLKGGEYNLKNIQIIGDELLTENRCIELGKIQMGESIFMVNYNKIHANLNKMIRSEFIFITPKFPDTLVVNIIRNSPYVILSVNQKNLYMDSSYHVLETSDTLHNVNIPIVSGLHLDKMPVLGEQLNMDKQPYFGEIEKILWLIHWKQITEEISEIVLIDQEYLRIITANNLVIDVKEFSELYNHFPYIVQMIQSKKGNLHINLMCGEKTIIKDRE